MIRTQESTGKTVDEARAKACALLGVQADDLNVSYEVLEMPQKTGFLGHLQHFIADIQIIGLYTQQSAGFCAGFIDRLAGRFLLTDHNRSPPSYSLSCLFSSLSGTVRSSL